ncbi:MAG: hypothetical protein IJ087_19145 [Eggerthellaceae bacterium]|nr:hypothetical protein [Eggerthellaceae bacterium]
MGDLSVFVDESGDTGANSRRYLVTLVLHEQDRPLDTGLAKLGGQLRNVGYPVGEAIHSGPLVRREEAYSEMGIDRRRKLFAALFGFAVKAPVAFKTFAYLKRELGARDAGEVAARLQARLARDVKLFLGERLAYLPRFDRVVVYYDNGQHAVTAAVREAFLDRLTRVEFRRVQPSGYRLFQAADLVCTLELLRLKDAASELSRSELDFFGSARRLRHDYLRHVERLRMP